MTRHICTVVFLVVGIWIGIFAAFHRYSITMINDVPFTDSEAITLHWMFGIITLFFLLASISMVSNVGRVVISIFFLLVFIFNAIFFFSYLEEPYFTLHQSQLLISALINCAIVILVNIVLIIKTRKKAIS